MRNLEPDPRYKALLRKMNLPVVAFRRKRCNIYVEVSQFSEPDGIDAPGHLTSVGCREADVDQGRRGVVTGICSRSFKGSKLMGCDVALCITKSKSDKFTEYSQALLGSLGVSMNQYPASVRLLSSKPSAFIPMLMSVVA